MKLTCRHCGREYQRKPVLVRAGSSYCNRACMAADYAVRMAASRNPNFKSKTQNAKTCIRCKSRFWSYSRGRKYCSHPCYLEAASATRHAATRDLNHGPIVAALRAGGVVVYDLSPIGGGLPDLLAHGPLGWQLLEVKNHSTPYGRRGLSAAQVRWSGKWAGAQPVLVHDVHEALAALGYR